MQVEQTDPTRRIQPIKPIAKGKDARQQSEENANAERQLPKPKEKPRKYKKPGVGTIIDIEA